MPLVSAPSWSFHGIAPGKRHPTTWSVQRNPNFGDIIMSNAAAAYTRSTKVVSFKRVTEDGAEFIYAVTESGSEYMLPVDGTRHSMLPHWPVEWIDVTSEYLTAEEFSEVPL
jgi:hypothetical protein